MKSLKLIAGFVFRRGLVNAANAIPVAVVQQAAAWTATAVGDHFTSHATELTEALQEAHKSAWGALAFSLGDDTALDLLRAADTRHLREQMRTFLTDVAPRPYSGAQQDELKHHCLEELRAASRAGLLDGGGIDMRELCRHVGSFAEISNAAHLLDAERAALAALADEFPANQYPHLRQLLELSPGNGEPFLIVAAGFFFKRQIAASESLARVVTYDLQIALLQEQRDGQAQVILKMDQQARELTEQFSLLRRELRAQDGCTIHSEIEQRLVRSLLKQFRDLPAPRQQALPDLLGNLARLAFAAGDFKESRQASADAAALAFADSAKAREHHNAYIAALEGRDWAAALDSLFSAVALDADRYMPFPFDKYTPARILGAGGFGVAFLCDHARLSRWVVVKTLQPAHLNRDVAQLFREAKDLEDLNHPGIVRLRDADYGDAAHKRPYFAMDYFEGQSLHDHVQANGPLALEQALELARQLAEALGYAHDKGILHRDVKPRNVLIRISGGRIEVKLIDFGLALRQSAGRTLANGHTLLGSSQAGTLEYAAPEQLGKLPGVPVDKYSDVYSWARTVCFALFGVPTPPFHELQELPRAFQLLLIDSLVERGHEIAKRPATMKVVLKRLAVCAESSPVSGIGAPIPRVFSPDVSRPSAPRGHARQAAHTNSSRATADVAPAILDDLAAAAGTFAVNRPLQANAPKRPNTSRIEYPTASRPESLGRRILRGVICCVVGLPSLAVLVWGVVAVANSSARRDMDVWLKIDGVFAFLIAVIGFAYCAWRRHRWASAAGAALCGILPLMPFVFDKGLDLILFFGYATQEYCSPFSSGFERVFKLILGLLCASLPSFAFLVLAVMEHDSTSGWLKSLFAPFVANQPRWVKNVRRVYLGVSCLLLLVIGVCGGIAQSARTLTPMEDKLIGSWKVTQSNISTEGHFFNHLWYTGATWKFSRDRILKDDNSYIVGQWRVPPAGDELDLWSFYEAANEVRLTIEWPDDQTIRLTQAGSHDKTLVLKLVARSE